jgi:predicted DsbA family dithiol-disulfide isomerase
MHKSRLPARRLESPSITTEWSGHRTLFAVMSCFAAALKQSLEMQGKVAERLFQAYFVNGEDVGDPAVLLSIGRAFGVSAISRVEDFDSPELVAEVNAAERKVSAGVQAVPQISFSGRVLASGAEHEDLLAPAIQKIQCENGVFTV